MLQPSPSDFQAVSHIGYCPQFDAILKEMSGSETLTMFARIRGLYEEDIPRCVNAVIQAIGIGDYAKRPIKTYRSVTFKNTLILLQNWRRFSFV